MRKHLRTALLTMVLVSVGTTSIYTNAMTLTYNGEIHQYTEAPIKLSVNGNIVETEVMAPVMIEERVMVPVREVFEPLGASIEWKNDEKAVYLSYKDMMMVMGAGDTNVWLNGETIEVDIPAMLINDKVMVPVRFIAENMNFNVNWVGSGDRTVYLEEIIVEEQPDIDIEAEEDGETSEENASGGGSFDDEESENQEDTSGNLDEEAPEEEAPEEDTTGDSSFDEESLEDEDEKENEDVLEDNASGGGGYEEEDDSTEVPLEELLDGIMFYYEGEKESVRNYVSSKTLPSVYVENVVAIRSDMGETLGMIEASGPISDVQVIQEDGKVIVDIINSKSALETVIKPEENEYIENIRTSQFTEDSTRVVFDLKSGTRPVVQLTQDRESIYIYFQPQMFEGFGYGDNKNGEFIVIENMVKTQMIIEGYANDGLMYINIPNTALPENFIWDDVEGEFIKEIYGVENGIHTEIIIMFKEEEEQPIRMMETMEGHTVIYFTSPTHDHIRYYGEDEDKLVIEKIEGMDIDAIQVEDLYREKIMHIDLGDNYQNYIGHGKINVNSDIIESIDITTSETTVLTVQQAAINAVEITEDEENIYIRFLPPTEKYDKIVILDIGHGGTDPGAIANGVREKDVNTKQALAIKEILENETDIKVYMTREEDDTLTLQYRAELANEIDGDIFVSIHNNAVTNNTSVTGTEVLYCPDPTNTLGKDMAQIMQDALVDAVGTVDRGIKSRGDVYVLRSTAMPAILLEGGFLTNAWEASRINSQEFNDKYARAAANAIVEIFDTMSFR